MNVDEEETRPKEKIPIWNKLCLVKLNLRDHNTQSYVLYVDLADFALHPYV